MLFPSSAPAAAVEVTPASGLQWVCGCQALAQLAIYQFGGVSATYPSSHGLTHGLISAAAYLRGGIIFPSLRDYCQFVSEAWRLGFRTWVLSEDQPFTTYLPS